MKAGGGFPAPANTPTTLFRVVCTSVIKSQFLYTGMTSPVLPVIPSSKKEDARVLVSAGNHLFEGWDLLTWLPGRYSILVRLVNKE